MLDEVKPADDVGEVSMLFGFPFRNERENGRVNHQVSSRERVPQHKCSESEKSKEFREFRKKERKREKVCVFFTH